ncbi:MAG: PAS domain S-box protein [Methyloprofundus sp.]|nr:PAS domain S-box protein [Methyloprofundus sp.]
MQIPAIPHNEQARLDSLYRLNVLDTSAEESYDRLTRLTKQLFDVPIALVSLVDEQRQWFKSKQGLEVCETGRDISFCGHAILGQDIFEIEDATQDARFSDNPLVTGEAHIRFYAGAPLITRDGYAIGTLCIIDTQPRKLTDTQKTALLDMADAVMSELELHESYKLNCNYEAAQKLTQVISQAQSKFIHELDKRKAFDEMLADILELTGSEYGFIGEVLYTQEGTPYLKTYAITNIAWNEGTRDFYDKHAPSGMEFYNLKSLFGVALTSGEPVISNDPYHDSRRGGLPEGHPALNAFLGLPIKHGDELVAMIGLSNRVGGYDQALIDYLSPLLTTIGQLVVSAQIKRKQHELEQSLTQFKTTVDQALDCVFMFDAQTFEFSYVNRGAMAQVGYTEQELIGMHAYDIKPLIDETQFRQMMTSIIESETRSLTFETVHQHKQGSLIDVEIFLQYVDSEDSTPHFVAFVRDITERKQILRAIKQERDLFSSGPVFTITWAATEHWPVQFVSDNIVEILGYSPSEMCAADFRYAELIHPADVERIGAEVAHNIAHHIDTYEQSYRLRLKNGEYRWFYDFTKLDRDQNGEVEMIRGYMFDQTEIKNIEQQLTEQSEHTQAILDNMVDGIVTIDANGIIQSFNPSAESIFGYHCDEVIGQNVSMLMPSPHREAHDSYIHNYLSTGVERIMGIGREMEGQKKDGSLFPMELSVSQITHKGQIQFVGMVRDITERKRIDRMKSEFVSTVSHELRTPLTSIAGALGLIVGGKLGEMPIQAQKMIGIAHKNTLRLSHLINDLLDMEKMVSGKLHFEMQVQPLLPILEQALENSQTYGAEQKISLILEADITQANVRVDDQRLQQVMANLLSNAIKYSPENGRVRICVKPSPGLVKVTVIDEGPGIPEAFRSRIFEKFSQADSSDTRQKAGTGLGLAITRELVERMDGRIGFNSVEGKGTSFWFELPVIDEKIQSTTNEAFPVLSNAPRILVVEDEPDVAEVLTGLLERSGFKIDIAYNGEQALSLLQKHTYDAMTLDLMLPGMSGIEVIRRVRLDEQTATLPILVISAKMEEGRLTINGDFSNIEWLAKPINEGRMLKMLEDLLNTYQELKMRVLHVEDDQDMGLVIAQMADERFNFETVTSLDAARAKLVGLPYDVILLDIGLPDGSGLDLLPDIHAYQPEAKIVILSGENVPKSVLAKVDAALLKSKVSSRELLDVLSRRTQLI